MRLHLCGVRGSTPTPGAAFTRYGGHTPCVAVEVAGRIRLLLDAGTGIRRVSALLDGAPFDGTVLLTHLHWDHVQGLPFFAAGDREDARVDVRLPAQDGDPTALFARVMSPPFFPIGPEGLRGRWSFGAVEEGSFALEGVSVLAREVPHKGGRTFGYRLEADGATVAYVPDHAPSSLGEGPNGFGPYHQAVLELTDGADVLLHDGQWTREEFATRRGFGHSAVEYAVGLATRCQVGRLVLFGHDPSHEDDALDAIEGTWKDAALPVVVAREGDTLIVP